ncbi:HD domain-containing protein [Amycolatopsis sp. NBC_00438]|uniref:HD domain-containing protein n=1 Tax=Amycolatopsis sp. NBC_00438 TaxID=2903558 RepID=UPI003FA4D0CC
MNDVLTLPAGPLAEASLRLAQESESAPIAGHSVRSFLFARLLARREGSVTDAAYDEDLLFAACVLHDPGAGLPGGRPGPVRGGGRGPGRRGADRARRRGRRRRPRLGGDRPALVARHRRPVRAPDFVDPPGGLHRRGPFRRRRRGLPAGGLRRLPPPGGQPVPPGRDRRARGPFDGGGPAVLGRRGTAAPTRLKSARPPPGCRHVRAADHRSRVAAHRNARPARHTALTSAVREHPRRRHTATRPARGSPGYGGVCAGTVSLPGDTSRTWPRRILTRCPSNWKKLPCVPTGTAATIGVAGIARG